jgi:hypothetical protein
VVTAERTFVDTDILRDVARVDIVRVESGDSLDASRWYGELHLPSLIDVRYFVRDLCTA